MGSPSSGHIAVGKTHAFVFAHYETNNCDVAQQFLMLDVNSSHPGWASHGEDEQ